MHCFPVREGALRFFFIFRVFFLFVYRVFFFFRPKKKKISKWANSGSVGPVKQGFFFFVALASTAHERTSLVTIVSYKRNVVPKHGSSKPLTTNELWLLEMQIKSTRILAYITDALWDMCKSSIVKVIHTF